MCEDRAVERKDNVRAQHSGGERETATHLEARECQSWRDFGGLRQKTLHKIGSDGDHKWKTSVPPGAKRINVM